MLRPVGGLVPQGIQRAHREKWGLSRETSTRSRRRASSAAQATAEGRFQNEIIARKGADGDPVVADEGIRPDTTVESLGKLKPSFKEDGKVTAGNSSQITDGGRRCSS